MSHIRRSRAIGPLYTVVAAVMVLSAGVAQSEPVVVELQMKQGDSDLGVIRAELFRDEAPLTVYNFLRYAKDDYYDGTVIHRVEPGFVIQGGGYDENLDLKRSGLRDPILNEWDPEVRNLTGTFSMARTGARHSATSQFFINLQDNESLDLPRPSSDDQRYGYGYAVFGKVAEGMDVVAKIAATELEANRKIPMGRPVTPRENVVIDEVRIVTEVDMAKLEEEAKAAARRIEEGEKDSLVWLRDFQKMQTEKLPEMIAEIERETDQKLQTTSSGLKYVIVEEGEGPSPGPNSSVTVHYTGRFVDGTVFDSSRKGGEPVTFGVNRVIAGWTEGLQLMKEGAKAKFVIDPRLAYGAQARPPRLPSNYGMPANAILVFDVELLKVN